MSSGRLPWIRLERILWKIETMPEGREYTHVPCDDLRALAAEIRHLNTANDKMIERELRR